MISDLDSPVPLEGRLICRLQSVLQQTESNTIISTRLHFAHQPASLYLPVIITIQIMQVPSWNWLRAFREIPAYGPIALQQWPRCFGKMDTVRLHSENIMKHRPGK